MFNSSGTGFLLAVIEQEFEEVVTLIRIALIASLVSLTVIVVVSCIRLVWYKRWLVRDTQHKKTLEDQMKQLSELLDHLSTDRQLPK